MPTIAICLHVEARVYPRHGMDFGVVTASLDGLGAWTGAIGWLCLGEGKMMLDVQAPSRLDG